MSTKPVLVFNKLYYFFHEIIGGTVYVDQDGSFVDWNPDENGESEDSLSIVAGFFGVTIMSLPGAWLVPDDPEDEFDEEESADDDSVSSWCTKNNEMILTAIKQAYIDLGEVEAEDAEEEAFEETEIVNHVGPVSDAVQQRDEEEKEEKVMSKKKIAKKASAKKIEATIVTFKVPVPVKPAKKVAKAKKPAKKTPVKGSKPTKGGKKKKK